MPAPIRIFVSHSSDDAALAQAVADGLKKMPGLAVDIDLSGLEAGKPWRRQLHEWMARCGAGIVLLTPAVLQRPKWVLKEAVILGWRLDLERTFSLFFVFAPGVTREDFEKIGFDMAQLSETQLLTNLLGDATDLGPLMAKIQASLPTVQPRTPFDDLITELTRLLRISDPAGVTYGDIAADLGITDAPAWGPDKLDLIAASIAREIVHGRDADLVVSGLIEKLGVWSLENRRKLMHLLLPSWIDMQMSSALLRRAPPTPPPQPPPPQGPGAVTIAGTVVPEFTAMMAVRRAFGSKVGSFRQAEAVGLNGGDLFEEIRSELCEYARQLTWVPRNLKNDADVVRKLRDSLNPIFVPLGVFPDAATLARLRSEFPRVVFIAPRPLERKAYVGDEILPDPEPAREKAAHHDWVKCQSALENG